MSKLIWIGLMAAAAAACGGGGGKGEGGQQVYVAAADDGEPRLVEVGPSLQELTWSPDSTRFAFFSEDPYGGPGDLLIVDPSNPGDAAEVPVPGNPHRIAWSPSGKKIAVVYFADNAPVLAALLADDTDLTTVRNLPPAQGFGSLIWLDDDKVLVEESAGSAPLLVSYDVASGERFQYDATPGFLGPVLSPDGAILAWSEYCDRDGPAAGIWTLQLATGALRNTDTVCGHLTDLAWSPDGSEIAYAAWYTTTDFRSDPHPETTGGVYVVSLASGKVRRITDPGAGKAAAYGFGEAVEVGVEWESSGKGFRVRRDHRYNCSDCGGAPELVLVSPDGSEETPVTEGEVQSASERSIAYANDDGFVISSLDGGDAKVVLKHDDEWRFRLAEFSPDGQWIAFTRFHCGDCTFP